MKKTIIAIGILCICTLIFAHEYVLLPYKFKVQKGDTLEVHLFVADGFNIQIERPVQKAVIKQFELITENGNTNLLTTATDGSLPILNAKVDFEGLGLIHMERDYSRIALATPKFKEYLKEDHIDNISVKGDADTKLQRERYSRYIKTLVLSGNKAIGDSYKKVVGQAFEVVLLQNPYTLKVGDSIKAQVLFLGKPLTNKTITARNRTGNASAIAATAKTNAQGICNFKLTRKGEWFIHATHMIPCPDKTDSDWESFWTSYSFFIER